MKKAGLDPAIIYAFEKTGLLVTEENQHLLPEKDLAEWEAAIAEYETHPGERGTARGRREQVVLGGTDAICQQEILGVTHAHPLSDDGRDAQRRAVDRTGS